MENFGGKEVAMKFQVFALYVGTRYLGEIEADSREEAEEIAWVMPPGLKESEYLTDIRLEAVKRG